MRSLFVPRRLAVTASLTVVVALAAGLSAGASAKAEALAKAAQSKLSDPSALTETAPDLFRARFETSKGPFVIEVHREWAPIAADRFYNLVKNGFYDGTRFFRVRPGFMAQFGINGTPEIQSAWQRAFLRDDPVTQKNTRGFVSFTNEGRPQSRFTQIFINYGDNSRLDADGFAPFGEVVTGMDVVDKLFSPPDPQPDQRRILREGNAYLQADFPKLDFVKKATIVPVPRSVQTPTPAAAPAPRRPS